MYANIKKTDISHHTAQVEMFNFSLYNNRIRLYISNITSKVKCPHSNNLAIYSINAPNLNKEENRFISSNTRFHVDSLVIMFPVFTILPRELQKRLKIPPHLRKKHTLEITRNHYLGASYGILGEPHIVLDALFDITLTSHTPIDVTELVIESLNKKTLNKVIQERTSVLKKNAELLNF